MNISRIASNVGNTVTKGAGKALETVSSSKFIQKELLKAKEDPAKFMAGMALFSLISKDAINCVVYTAKSWNNKKLENPKFMAFLDLVQGILNVSAQFLVGKAILEKKLTPALQGKYTGTVKTTKTVDSLEKSAKAAKKNGLLDKATELKEQAKKVVEDAADNIKDSVKESSNNESSNIVKTVLDNIGDETSDNAFIYQSILNDDDMASLINDTINFYAYEMEGG